MGRKEYTPTDEQRHLVEVLSSYGIRQSDIALEAGFLSPKTLRKHCREELDRGRIGANINVGKTMYRMAISGKRLSATVFWLTARAGWRAKSAPEERPAAIPDFVVGREKKEVA
jgi:hypothetical protein